MSLTTSMDFLKARLLIVGDPQEFHVGGHLMTAANRLGITATLKDIREVRSRSVWINRFFHRAMRHRPAYLKRFSRQVVVLCHEFRPSLLLVTGISAPDSPSLVEISKMHIRCANFLTDDPWNPKNAAGFFWTALCQYDVVFSPRRANIADLRRHGCGQVKYLPFGYNPEIHFPEEPATEAQQKQFACDVAFVGGADADRLPLARALVRAGFRVKLYGGYWDRDAELRPHWHGFVHGRDLRMATSGALVNICIGRKANRDGHAMRSLELPAMGACMLVEDTPEHRELFGRDNECVVYFATVEEMLEQTKKLCQNPDRARQLGRNVVRHICENARHTYASRLMDIIRG